MPERELVLIVDRNNTEVGVTTRRQMRTKKLPHRAAYVLVFNSKGEIFIQKRTKNKDIYPGHYDVASGGVVLAGESYEMSASRELQEELGIKETPLTPLFDFYYEDRNNIVWGRAFSCVYDGQLSLQAEEVEEGFFSHIAKALELSEQKSFTPDGITAFKKFLAVSGTQLD